MRRVVPRDDLGQTSVLVIGFFLVGLLMVVVVVDASAAYLHRQRLDALADGAALAATESLEAERVYTEGLGERGRIDPVAARQRVAAYLRQVGAHGRHRGLQVEVRTTADSVEVEVASAVDLPFVPAGWDARAVVTGRAASYVEVSD